MLLPYFLCSTLRSLGWLELRALPVSEEMYGTDEALNLKTQAVKRKGEALSQAHLLQLLVFWRREDRWIPILLNFSSELVSASL